MMMRKLERGFTLVELTVVIGIVLILFGLSWINFTSLPSRATLQTSVISLINDIKSQQMLSMTGDTGGSGVESDYGVHFETITYTLFKGDTYIPGAAGNFTIDLENANLSFTGVSFPGNVIIFTKGSGEMTPGEFSITDALSGTVKTIKLNKYGATTN